MKLTIVFVAGVLLIGALAGVSELFFNDDTEVLFETKEVIKEVHPEWSQDQDAVDAAKAVIRRKEVEARIEVLNAEIDVRELERIELSKELGTF